MQEDGGPAGGEAAGDGRDSDQGEREAACGGKGMFLGEIKNYHEMCKHSTIVLPTPGRTFWSV